MNTTDAEIDKIRGEISRLCSDIWSNGFDAEGPDDKDFCHEIATIDVILEGLYGRVVVDKVDGDVKTPESCGEYLKLSEKEKMQLMKQEASK